MYGIFGCFVSFAFYHVGICEVYTSTADMKNVIELETGLIETLENYIQLERQKINLLNRYLESYKKENNKALENMELYVGNAVNAYLIVKRLVKNWEEVELLLGLNNNRILQNDIKHYREHIKFPTSEDLNGTVVALIRLQDTYNLDTASVARGELNGVKCSLELSASDCFEIGKGSYENGNFYYSHSWLMEAENKIKTEVYNSVETSLVLKFIALSAYKLGNISLALNVTNRLLRVSPSDPEAIRMKVLYEEEIQKGNYTETIDALRNTNQPNLYKQICRGDVVLPIEILSKLKCRYVNNDNPFLLIAPFRLEEVSLRPKIVLFHNVISDEEINVLTELSHSRFERAQIGNYSVAKNYYSLNRIAKVAWFYEDSGKHVADINRRVSHMTGLSVETAEPLQVCNYGVGGHFLKHYDFIPDLNLKFGNRIATVLFYMSDVSQGGGTVFPVPNVIIKPRKGSAAFWYNLHPNGEGDKSTAHSACPVLIGSKWVSNKWLYSEGQEFLRPCEVNRFSPNWKS